MSAFTRRLAVRQVIERCEKDSQRVLAGLPQEEVQLWGEVLSVRRGRKLAYLTIRDAQNDDMVMEATLPNRCSGEVRVGNMIGIRGVMAVDASQRDARITVKIGGNSYFSRGQSERYQRRLARFSELKSQFEKPTPLQFPFRELALVAPLDSRGAEDFLRSLSPQERGIAVKIIRANFHSPPELAFAMTEALQNSAPIAVVRGGGDPRAMDVFNHEHVFEAVWKCGRQVPVILAIGHMADQPLAAGFASMSYITPTQAGHKLAEKHMRSEREARKAMAQHVRPAVQPKAPRKMDLPARSVSAHRIRYRATGIVGLLGSVGGWHARRYIEEGLLAAHVAWLLENYGSTIFSVVEKFTCAVACVGGITLCLLLFSFGASAQQPQ